MAIQLVSADSLARSNGVKIIVYGRSGMGKTMLAATCPSPIIISAERGLLSLKRENIQRVWGADRSDICYDIPVIVVDSLDTLVEAQKWFLTNPQAQQFQTIVMDSITEIAEKVLLNAKKGVKDPRQAYGVLLEQMTQVIKEFRDMEGKHVVMLAKEERVKDDGTGLTLAQPSMPGQKMGPAAPYLTDEVFQIGVQRNPADGTSYRYLRTQPDFNADAKDRSGMLAELEAPHIGSIIHKIMASGH